MVMGPAWLGPKNNCGGDGQRQFIGNRIAIGSTTVAPTEKDRPLPSSKKTYKHVHILAIGLDET
jgi:hypothetical protein